MAKQEYAPGLPDPQRFGSVKNLPRNRELLWVIQKHLADRAGPHFDMRLGPDAGHKPTMMSWAARKLPKDPGDKTMAFQQPLHTGAYADFEGEIVSGYGKGIVKTHDKGSVLVTKIAPDKINFVVTHKKHPETFTLIRKTGVPKTAKGRAKKTQGGTWLMINTTPTKVIDHKKVHYTRVDQEDIEKLFDPKYLHMEKIDGAAALYKLLSDKIEVLSYRPTKKGRPIIHTYRVGGSTGLNIPKHLVGSVLRGELYGVRGDGAIPPQELGGILNASTSKSLQKQRDQRVELKNAIFNVLKYGKEDVPMSAPLAGRLEKVKEILGHLPKGKYHLPRTAATPEEQRKLWKDVTSGEYPITREGIVAWPVAGGKPTKVKIYDEHDVYIRDIFPGKKRLEGVGAGGFGYSLDPGGERVGEVGTGLSDELRGELLNDPERYLGRVARVKAQEKFPSGALRAPSLIAMHEDYPAKQAAEESEEHEAKCNNCGKCCYKKIKFSDDLIVATKDPCEHLDTDTNMCKIYNERHEKHPTCLSVEEGIKQKAMPEDCPYVAGLKDYVGPIYFDDPEKEANMDVIGPLIKEATNGVCSDMAGLVKLAGISDMLGSLFDSGGPEMPDSLKKPTYEMPDSVKRQMGISIPKPEPIDFKTRALSWATGQKPKQMQTSLKMMKMLSSVGDVLRRLGILT